MIWKIFAFLQKSLLFFSTSFWWNHDQSLSMLILKKSSLSVSPIKWRTFAMLPRWQFHWEMLMATGIDKLWQNSNIGSAICISNALDLFLEWSIIMIALFSEVIACTIFDLMLYSTLINLSAWLSAENKHSSISQFPTCSSFHLLLQDPQKLEEFHKICANL